MNYIPSSLIFFFVCGFRVSISLCHPCCHGTYYVDQAVLNLQRSACLCLPSAVIKSVHQHTHPKGFLSHLHLLQIEQSMEWKLGK